MPKYVELFTDGACKGNPGVGGWGALMRFGETEKRLFGAEAETTNNRMELMAVICSLEALDRALLRVDNYRFEICLTRHDRMARQLETAQLANRGEETCIER